MRVTWRRYGLCVGSLPPLKDYKINETEYLIKQTKVFLDQANYDNEQLANVTNLMDTICRLDNSTYPVSSHINVTKYARATPWGKENRCKSIDEVLDAMFPMLKRAALNHSEPLDFSSVLFYPNASDDSASYNLTDLINTSWIEAEAWMESVCHITDMIKEYVQLKGNNSIAQDRASQQSHSGFFYSLLDMIDRILDPIFGIQKRFYWESNNRLGMAYSSLSNQLGNLRDGFGSRIKSGRNRISNLFASSANSTKPMNSTNATNSTQLVNSTRLPSSFNATNSVKFAGSSPSTAANFPLPQLNSTMASFNQTKMALNKTLNMNDLRV